MSDQRMSNFIEQMKMVEGVGMGGSALSQGDKKLPVNENNSMRNATLAYEKMCEGTIRSSENEKSSEIKRLGAIQAIKEIIEEGDVLDKNLVAKKINSIKKIIESI
jgi:uncharacterized protein with WD repeat